MPLIPLWAFVVCYRVTFTFTFIVVQRLVRVVTKTLGRTGGAILVGIP
jgi:hypothetical protein